MPNFSQQTRILSLATPLGDDVLLLTGFSGREELSQLFSYQPDMFSEEDDLDPTAIVGKAVTWAVSWHGNRRYFNGVVRRFSAGPHHPHGERRRVPSSLFRMFKPQPKARD
jgi:type VI secretion system secreted protein VgrG